MKKILSFLLLVLTLSACQQKTYKIIGTAEGFSDGEVLILSTDFAQGVPTDSMLVKDGRFELQGTADSVLLAVIYSLDHPELSTTFLLEPGTITVDFSQKPGQSKVGGTKANDGWQMLTELTNDYSKQMMQMAEELYGDDISEEKQTAIMEQGEKLQAELNDKIIKMAEENIDNELGFFLVTNFNDGITPERRQELIAKMPAEYRERSAVKELEKEWEEAKKTEKGQKMPDFTLGTPDGSELSVMSEVAKNQLTILDFWASWCGPCRQETPFMVELYKKYHEKGLGIVGISLDEDHDAWVAAIKELGMTWPQVSDLGGWSAQPANIFHVSSIPFMVVVDQQGTIIEKGLRGEKLEQFISEQLK